MPTVSPEQIAAAARNAGFPADQIATAVAVALAESGGKTDATNRNTNGSVDYGLWQINTVHGSLLSQGNKFDPNDNAKMAYQVYTSAGGKWTPWVTYNRGTYRTFIPRATIAAGSSTPAASVPGAEAAATPVADTPAAPAPDTTGTGILALLTNLTSGGLWARVGIAIFGGVLLLFSLWKLTGAGDVLVGAATGRVKRVVGA